MRAHSAFLIRLLENRPLNFCAEIGVFRGDNAVTLLRHLPIQYLIGVDPYKRYNDFDKNLANKTGPMAKANLDEVKNQMLKKMEEFKDRFRLMTLFSDLASACFDPESFDFVFIDGNHIYSYVYVDIKSWLPLVKRGGIIAGHDYVDKRNYGVIRAVNELLPDHKINKKAKVWWYQVGEET